MKQRPYHTRTFLAGLILSVLLGIAASPVVRADKSGKSVSPPLRVFNSNGQLSIPSLNAVEIILAAAQNAPRSRSRTVLAADTNKTESKIIAVRATPDVLNVRVNLGAEQDKLEVTVLNLLGKEMKKVYSGYASKGEHEYSSSISDLPEGVYICTVQGSNFRRAEKFYLSR